MNSNTVRYRVVTAVTSELISAGLADVIADSAHFKLVATVATVDVALSRLAIDRPDMFIVDAATIADIATLRNAIGSDVTLVALVHSYVPLAELRRYDTVIDVAQSRGEIIRQLIDTARAAGDKGESDETSSYELSKRETDVLVMVAKGLTNKEIADALNLSVHTVISHRKNIMHKTGIKSVAGLTMYAILNKLL